jgi:hypothetical protein
MSGYACTRGASAMLAVLLLAGGCNSTGSSFSIGAKGGACTAGGACDPGLVCVAGVCASPGDTGGTTPTACSSSALGGIGMPEGTVVSASATYSTYVPDKVIDGELGRGWNSGSNSGWLRFDFPKAIAITGLHVAANASPTTDETFVITDSVLGTTIGTATRRVLAGATGALLDPIPVTPGSYSSITITMNATASWVEISEVSLLTAECSLECGCETRMCGDDGCGTNCGTCESGETCNAAGECVS